MRSALCALRSALRALRQIRDTKPLPEDRLLQLGDLGQDSFGQVAENRRGRLNAVFAQDVADADAEQLFVLEAVQDWVDVGGAAAEFRQLGPQLFRRARLIEDQAVQHLINHAGIINENLRQELTPSAQIDVELQARGIETEELPQHCLGAERGRYFFEIEQGHVRVGRFGQSPQQARRNTGQEMPATSRG